MTIVPLPHSGNKDVEEIQQIVTSTEVANLAKQVVRATADLIMIAKKKQSDKSNSRPNKKCFNYGKKGHYAKNCRSSTSNKRKLVEELIEEAKHV